ncbi:ATP-binding protein [Microcoleus sp. D2_18a_D3]|uniref:ATP-binding protein n=1 Tax=Microcoleus sp. D2_18a_D3 TaxID=3055330 RepID=UPI002FD57348
MLLKLKKSALAKSFSHVPIRTILIVPFVLQIFAAVGLTGYLSLQNGQKAVNDLAFRLQNEVSLRIDQHLNSYLDTARYLAQINGDAIELGLLNPQSQEQLGHFFWKQMQLYNVGYISLGTKTGEFTGAGYYTGNSIVVNEISVKKNGNRDNYIYETDSGGNRSKLFEVYKNYKFDKEAWYAQTVQAGKPMWSDIYQWEIPPFPLAVSANRPVFDKNKNLIGVIGIDQRLSQISDFLRQLKVSRSGKTFILERSGLIVASSSTELPYTLVNDKPRRLKAIESRDRLIQSAAQYLQQKFGNFREIKESQQLQFSIKGDRQFLHVTPWQDKWGLDWLVVVAVPESDFMEQINANTRTTILLCLAALGVAIALGIYTSRWISQPILRLGQASEAIASGELDQQVEASPVNELGVLSNSFNRMAQQLRESFAALEKTNQELEIRVESRTRELKEAKLVADAANRAKSDFLANMSHELRTPLNGILGYAQILERSQTMTEPEQHGISIIHQCGSHLLTLINDILDLSKIEARKMELHPTAFHLPSFLQGVVEISRIKAEQKDIEFHYQPTANLPDGIAADEKRLRQVLLNLLGNAIKFTDNGSVSLEINFSSHPSNSSIIKLHFRVRDTGVGMSSEQLEKIFLPFEQVGDNSRKAEGTGLGLAITQKILEMMDSSISVQSELGVGSVFEFEISCPLAADWMHSSSLTKTGKIIGYSGRKKQILIVDDRWENRSVIVNILQPLGFVIMEAENGREGLEKIAELPPDLIITDLSMPVVDGWELLSEVRQSENLKNIPVIVSSASVYEMDKQQSLAAGGDDFLSKPVQAEELYVLLAKHLELSWVYAQTLTVPLANLQEQAEVEMVVPPASELANLREYARKGQMKGIEQELEKLTESDAKYQPFVNQLNQLVKEFNIQKIRQFLQQG